MARIMLLSTPDVQVTVRTIKDFCFQALLDAKLLNDDNMLDLLCETPHSHLNILLIIKILE